MKPHRRTLPALAVASAAALTAPLSAQLTWDPDGNQISDGGAGTWDTAAANWDDDGSAPNVSWTNGSNAVFGDAGGNYTVDLGTGVSVGDLTYSGSNRLQIKSLVDNTALTLSGNAAWNTGGGEIEFLNNQANDTKLDLAGNTLTVNGGGVFDTGEKGNGANWGAGNLVFSEATTLRGAAFSVGQLTSVTMAGGSFIMERNSNQDINNNWVLNGDTTFDNRFNGRTVWANGVFSGTGRLTVQGLGTNGNGGAGYLRLNDTLNSWSGGLTVNGGINNTVVNITGGDAVLGAAPGTFDADNIILKDGGGLKLFTMAVGANRGITLEGSGGILISANGVNTINGAITGVGALQIGRASDGAQNVILLNSNASDYAGDTKVVRGTLRLGVDNATPDGSVVVIGGAAGGNPSSFDMNGFDTEIGGLRITGGNTRQILNNGASASTLTIDVADGESYSYNANVTGSNTINIEKTGLGTQSIGRTGNYTTALGNVSVNGGELIWNNNSGTTLGGAMTVGTGGTLSGTGVVGGVATVGGNLNPGLSPGTMTFEESLTMESTATLTLEFLSTTAGDFDVLLNDGGDTFTAAGTLDLVALAGYVAAEGDEFLVLENWGGYAGAFDTVTGLDLGDGLAFDDSTLLTDGTLRVVVIPEVSTSLLSLLALAGLIARRRR